MMAEIKKKVDAPSIGTIARKGGIVTVVVGPEHVRYEVHKTLLVHHSEYFRGAFSGLWREAEDSTVVIEDVEPTTFNVFLNWLYTRKIPTYDYDWIHVAEAIVPSNGIASLRKTADLMALQAMIFGDRFLIPNFQEAVHNYLVDLHMNEPRPAYYASIIYAYANPTKGNPILDLFAEVQARYWDDGQDEVEELLLRPELPNDFLVRVMQKHAAYRGTAEDKHEPLEPSSYCLRPHKGNDNGEGAGAERDKEHGKCTDGEEAG